MKTFTKKAFIVFIFAYLFILISGPLIHNGDNNITNVDYQILYDLDYPQTQLGDLSLRDFFENRTIPALSNLVTNGNFSNGTTGYLANLVTLSVSNNELTNTITTLGTANGIYKLEPTVIIGNVYYYRADVFVKYNNTINLRIGSISNFISPVLTNQWVTLSKGIIPTTTEAPILYHVTNTSYVVGDTFKYRRIQLFNLTASHGVTSTSGTAYDNAVAEIEWFLSINNGYLSSQDNWFEDTELTVAQMDYWYTIYTTLKGLE